MIGQTISHYKILEKIGGGGMGVVYKAEDTRLKRTVALKFLPSELTLDPEAKERFTHEAQAASALDHPNICTVYDVDESADGRMFIAMACYEGETLKSRIANGKLRVEEATGITIQIAQGLAKAHEGGIVHRDIKPANIMITKDGIVKIVDFGLAKLSSATKITKSGSTLGTVAYMAPEQLQGGNVDARADIFSVGVVLYEMLTGRTPFRGDHEAALMYSIMNEEPEPLQTQIPDATSELIHVVGRALEKDPASRYKTMDDLLIDLMRVRKETSKVSMPAYGVRRRSFFTARRIVLMSSAIILAGVAVTLFLLNQPRKVPRLNPATQARQVVLPFHAGEIALLSPDGNSMVFRGRDKNGESQIYVMNTSGGGSPNPIAHASAGGFPHDWSRDGQKILYDSPDGLRMVPFLGGQSQRIKGGVCTQFLPGSDRIVYYMWPSRSSSHNWEIHSVKLDGGDERVLLKDPGYFGNGEAGGFAIGVSPDGRSIAFVKTFPDLSQDIITYNLDTKAESQITFSRTGKDEVIWTHDNYLIYTAFANGNWDLWMVPAEGGSPQPLTNSRLDERKASLSDDGSRLLYYEFDVGKNIIMMDLETGKVTPITSDGLNRCSPCVSPDNRFVAYSYCNYGTGYEHKGIEVRELTKEGVLQTICSEERTHGSRAWSPDGKWIAYSRLPDSVGGTIKICIVSPSDGTRSRIVAEARDLTYPRWVSRDTLSWFSEGEIKTWMSSVEDPKPLQLYEDSTNVFLFRDRGYLLYQDYRAGRKGWWTNKWPTGKGEIPRKIPVSGYTIVAQNGEFLLDVRGAKEIYRISLPDGESKRLPFDLPAGFGWNQIAQDGKALFYLEYVNNSKLMLWENPFIKE